MALFISLAESIASEGLKPIRQEYFNIADIGAGNTRIISFTLESMTSSVNVSSKNLCNAWIDSFPDDHFKE
jgi:hypothetical protein